MLMRIVGESRYKITVVKTSLNLFVHIENVTEMQGNIKVMYDILLYLT